MDAALRMATAISTTTAAALVGCSTRNQELDSQIRPSELVSELLDLRADKQ